MKARLRRRPAIGRPSVVAQVGATFLERGRARAIVTLGREQRVAAADAVIEGLGEGAGVDAPVHHIELATARGRPSARGQSVDRRPGLIFGVVMGNDAAIDEPALEAFAPGPQAPFKTVALDIDKAGQH